SRPSELNIALRVLRIAVERVSMLKHDSVTSILCSIVSLSELLVRKHCSSLNQVNFWSEPQKDTADHSSPINHPEA
mgnify:CR=1